MTTIFLKPESIARLAAEYADVVEVGPDGLLRPLPEPAKYEDAMDGGRRGRAGVLGAVGTSRLVLKAQIGVLNERLDELAAIQARGRERMQRIEEFLVAVETQAILDAEPEGGYPGEVLRLVRGPETWHLVVTEDDGIIRSACGGAFPAGRAVSTPDWPDGACDECQRIAGETS